MLRYAAENGYEKLSWDTGKTNFERMFGSKEEGQAGFYDKILPDFMRKYVKKWDSKVEKSNVNVPLKNKGAYAANNGDNTYSVHLLNLSRLDEKYPTMEEAEEAAKRYNSRTTAEVHSVDITHKMKESVMEGQPLFQKKKGSLQVMENGKNILRLFKSQDASTPFHELGHQWLEELHSDVRHPESPKELQKDWGVVKDFLNISEDQKGITRPQHELFARTFERYLREGVAPSEELKNVFTKIRDWLIKIYDNVVKLNAPISNEVRGVFDRLLSERKIEAELKEQVAKESAPKAEPLEALEQRDRPSHKRLPLVKGSGEEVNYGLANRLNKALQENFDSELTDIPTRQRAQFKIGQARVAEEVSADPQAAYEIAMGNRPVTGKDVTPEMYWNAMTQYATSKKDLQMLNDLSQSRLVKELTTMAQRLSSLRSGYDTKAMPNAAMIMRSIEEARNEYFQKNSAAPGAAGIKTRQPLTVEEQSKLVDLTDQVQQDYLNYKDTNKYDDRIKWGNSFLKLKEYVDSLKPRYSSKLDKAQEYLGEAVGTFKVLQTGIGDFSALLVQGLGSMAQPEF